MVAKKRTVISVPSHTTLIEFIGKSSSPVSKRELARAFRLSGPSRIELSDLLLKLEEDGAIRRVNGRKYILDTQIPNITVLEIVGINRDGDVDVKLAEGRFANSKVKIGLSSRGHRGPAPGVGDRVLARLSKRSRETYSARIIRIINRQPARVFGVFRAQRDGGRLEPADRRYKSEFLIASTNTGGAKDGEFVACETIPGRAFGLPLARINQRIGPETDPLTVQPLVIAKNNIPNCFTEDALSQARRTKAASAEQRYDLRDLPLVTIDEQSAQDFDDAVWAEPDDDPENIGGFHMVVAIADVSWYVQPGDPLDVDARLRGNSVYLPNLVIPMLPEELSNGWCSLIPGEDRPCMAVEIWINSKGRKLRHQFRRSIMRSAARLNYDQVQQCHDNSKTNTINSGIPDGIVTPLYGALQALLKARKNRGAIELELPERRIKLAKDGQIDGIETRQRLDSHRLVEEFMIVANVCAAESLETMYQPCMYRVHDAPDSDRVSALKNFLQSMGLGFSHGKTIRPKHFAQLISQTKNQPFAEGIQDAVLRCQAKAVYNPENIGHYGLAMQRYAHFTSPIRRYADLIVHRALITGLKLGQGGLEDNAVLKLSEVGEHISMTERRAVVAERECFNRLCAYFMKPKIGSTFTARINGVEKFGLFVELVESGASALLPASALGRDYYTYVAARMALISENSGEEFRLGDTILVRLTEAQPTTGSLSVELADRATRYVTAESQVRGRRSNIAIKNRRKRGKKLQI